MWVLLCSLVHELICHIYMYVVFRCLCTKNYNLRKFEVVHFEIKKMQSGSVSVEKSYVVDITMAWWLRTMSTKWVPVIIHLYEIVAWYQKALIYHYWVTRPFDNVMFNGKSLKLLIFPFNIMFLKSSLTPLQPSGSGQWTNILGPWALF